MEDIKIYDNDGITFDRYTIIIDDDVYTMSHNALSPQGYNQYMGTLEIDLIDIDWSTDILIGIDDVPIEVQEAIKRRLEG